MVRGSYLLSRSITKCTEAAQLTAAVGLEGIIVTAKSSSQSSDATLLASGGTSMTSSAKSDLEFLHGIITCRLQGRVGGSLVEPTEVSLRIAGENGRSEKAYLSLASRNLRQSCRQATGNSTHACPPRLQRAHFGRALTFAPRQLIPSLAGMFASVATWAQRWQGVCAFSARLAGVTGAGAGVGEAAGAGEGEGAGVDGAGEGEGLADGAGAGVGAGAGTGAGTAKF